jgi:hypothetical protein
MSPKHSKLATGTSYRLAGTPYKSQGKKIIEKRVKKKPAAGGLKKGKAKNLFRMTIHSSISSIPFASVNKHGYIHDENDHLLKIIMQHLIYN